MARIYARQDQEDPVMHYLAGQRAQRGITQEQIGAVMGIHQTTVANLESGRVRMTPKKRVAYQSALIQLTVSNPCPVCERSDSDG